MTSLIAARSFPYAGRTVQAGESFTALSSQDARALTLGKLAVAAPDPEIELGPFVPENESPHKPKRISRRRTEEVSDGD